MSGEASGQQFRGCYTQGMRVSTVCTKVSVPFRVEQISKVIKVIIEDTPPAGRREHSYFHGRLAQITHHRWDT